MWELLIPLVPIWIGAFLLHERCHAYAAYAQGCGWEIQIWFYRWHKLPIPSMRCIYYGKLQHVTAFYLAGGYISGLSLLWLTMVFYLYEIYFPVYIWLGTLGWMNLIYSFYEATHYHLIGTAKYMREKNIIYALCASVWLIINIPLFIEYFS